MLRNRACVLFAATAVCLSTQALAEKWQMPNGQVYENPVVMGHNPRGLDIGFNGGVAFWKFSDLPEWLQKKYHYNPAKAAAYEKEVQADKAALMKREVAKEAENEQLEVQEFAAEVEGYGRKIQETEQQIKHYKQQMTELESEYKEDQDRVTKLAETPVSGENSGNAQTSGWGMWASFGGNEASNRDALVKDKTNKRFERQADDDRFKRRGLRTGLYQLERDLPVMKTTYKHMQERLAKMKAELKNHPDTAAKAVKTKAVSIQDYENDLTKLTEMHRQGIITDSEYNAKRAEIINEM